MGKISTSNPRDRTWTLPAEQMPESERARFSDGELRSLRRTVFPVDGEALELFEIRYGPDVTVQSHAHDEDEIIVVTSGELRFGKQVIEVGGAIYVERDTLYSFRTGATGCTFMNFRPRLGVRYITKQDFLLHRNQKAG